MKQNTPKYNCEVSRRTAIPFIKRWMKKANAGGWKVEDAIEREAAAVDGFVARFIAFNRLYNELWAQKHGVMPEFAKGEAKKHKDPESKRASEDVVARVDSPAVLERMETDLRNVREMLTRDDGFYLKRPKEKPFFRSYESWSENKRLTKTLKALYLLRCNLFHGSKGLETSQERILEPANACLDVIIEEGVKALETWEPTRS